MKSYTDIEQSKKLAEILSLESADMHYARIEDDDEMRDWTVYLSPIPKICAVYVENLPCWSLAALLNLLPNNEHIETTISRGSWKIDTVEYLPNTWWCEYEDTENQTEFNISADNSIDACYEMILKLHELKLL